MSASSTERTRLRVAVGALTVVLIAAELLTHHSATQKVLGVVLLAVLAVVTVTDIEERRIPNRVVGPAALAALVIGAIMDPSGVPGQAFAGVATAGFLLLFALLSRGGLGMGDVKLGLVLGLFLRHYVLVALVVGLAASAVYGVALLVRLGVAEGRRATIPMAPFLAFGGAVAVLAGPLIGAHWG